MRNFISRNPYNGQIKEKIQFVNQQLIEKHLERATIGFDIHRKRGAREKCNMIKALTPIIDRQRDQIAKLITYETGKPIVESQLEITYAIRQCQYYSKHFEFILAQNVKTDAKKKTLIKYFPTGTVFSVLPFTFPFLMNFKTTLPQLLLGNGVLVRNSDSTPGVGKLVQKLIWKVGFQSGEYQNIFSSAQQNQLILSNDQICGLHFIGSSYQGANVAAIAGKYIKKTSLQLNGNDVLIVLQDANLHLAVQNCLKIGLFNSGQGPTPKRLIVRAEVYNTFKDLLIQKMKSIKYGNPELKETQMGPLATPESHDKLQEQLGQLPSQFNVIFRTQGIKAPFFPLTLIEGSSNFFDQEIAGPVFQIIKVQTDEQTVRRANSSRYKTNTSVFSSERGKSLMDELIAGQVYLNDVATLTPNLPYGGVGRSGYGRSGWSEGVHQFANLKTTYIS